MESNKVSEQTEFMPNAKTKMVGMRMRPDLTIRVKNKESVDERRVWMMTFLISAWSPKYGCALALHCAVLTIETT